MTSGVQTRRALGEVPPARWQWLVGSSGGIDVLLHSPPDVRFEEFRVHFVREGGGKEDKMGPRCVKRTSHHHNNNANKSFGRCCVLAPSSRDGSRLVLAAQRAAASIEKTAPS